MESKNAKGSLRPPGPRGYWLLGNLPDFAGDLLGFVSACARDYGDIVHLRLGPDPAVLLSHPNDIEQILVTRHADFTKHRFFWRHVTRLFGNGLLTSTGDLWRRQHALMAPAFRQERLAFSLDEMFRSASRIFDTWREGEERDIRADMTRLTLEIVSRVLFGVDLDSEVGRVSRAVDRGVEEVSRRFKRGLSIPEWIPTPGNRRYRATVRDLDATAAHILARRRKAAQGGTDLLWTLLQVRDVAGHPLDARLLRDEIITLLLAGHETTALALTWTLFLLARHPQVAAQVEDEVDAELGAGRPPGAADLARLRCLGAVITEAMRLYPPVYMMGRQTLREVEIGGYRLPRGTVCLTSQWVVHRDARFFPEPETFKPERWIDASAPQRPRFAYFPFGGGPRICLGQPLALLEAKLILATLCQRFRLAAGEGPEPRPFPSVTLRPDRTVRLRISRRLRGPAALPG